VMSPPASSTASTIVAGPIMLVSGNCSLVTPPRRK
jgi:hypothetical protein